MTTPPNILIVDPESHEKLATGLVALLKPDGSPWTPGSDAFIDLPDTPSSYAGAAQFFVKVNASATGLEFVAGSGVSAAWGDLTGTLSNQTDLQNALDAKLNLSATSAFGRSLIDDANAAAARATLELGSAATTASSAYATAVQGATADTAIQPAGLAAGLSTKENAFAKGNVVAGTGVTLSGDGTGRLVGAGNLTINATGSGGQVDEVVAGTGITVNAADPTRPVVGLPSSVQTSLGRADSAVQPGSLATVATSGAYGDLSGRPTLGTMAAQNASDYTLTANLGSAAFASTGDFEAAFSKGNLIAGDGISLSGTLVGRLVGPGNITITATGGSGVYAWGGITGTLADQTDLQAALDAKANSSALATVATSGAYDDLSNKPSIPAAQVNADWGAGAGVAQILNKPTLGTAAAAATSDFAPASHVGAGGTAHSAATTSAAGFMSAADKTKLDGIATGATANTGTVTSVGVANATGLTWSGGPITSSGTLTPTLSANLQAWHGIAPATKQDVAVIAADNGTSYDVAAADVGRYRRLTATSAKTINVRTQSTHALPDNGEWHFDNDGTGNATFAPAGGVTIKAPAGGTLVVPPNGVVTLKRLASDVFRLIGVTVAA